MILMAEPASGAIPRVPGELRDFTNRVDPGPIGEEREAIEEKAELPLRWEAALDAFQAGSILPKYLVKRYHDLYVACRREECDRFHADITDCDYDWYLRAV